MHRVKCLYCGTTFDRDSEAYAQIGKRRYAHASCALRECEKNKNLEKPQIIDPTDFVTCIYCKETFNKSDEPFKLFSNGKYAHQKCFDLEQTRELTDQEKLEKYIWQYFLNQRIAEYNNTYYRTLIPNIITDRRTPWYSVLDLIEATIDFLRDYDKFTLDSKVADDFIGELNQEFKRLNFAYRIVADQVIDITSEEEMGSVDQAIKESPSNIQMHLSKAVEMYAQKPEGDYRNSIKESISAVEAY